MFSIVSTISYRQMIGSIEFWVEKNKIDLFRRISINVFHQLEQCLVVCNDGNYPE